MGFWQSSDGRELQGLLVREGERFGLSLTEEQVFLLERQLELVQQENARVNLTAIRDLREAVIKHLVDSMAFYPAYAEYPGVYLDLGTGAGYPGMVLELLKPREGVLLDSVAKKIDACRRIAEQLGLTGVRYVAERAERFALEEPEAFGVITARAVAPVGVLLEYAQPLLEREGVLVMSKGRLGDEENEQGLRVAEYVGMECVSRETISLSEDAGERTLLVFQKVGASQIPLPRRIGRATKKPL